ncbi:hypothetical protein CsSME_00017166 [Camellia sinensis var. sinensis]
MSEEQLLAESKGVWEVGEIIGEEWNNMTKKQKKPYEKVQLTFFFSLSLSLSLSLCNSNFIFWELANCKAKQGKVFGRNGGLQAEEGGRVCQSQKRRGSKKPCNCSRRKRKPIT